MYPSQAVEVVEEVAGMVQGGTGLDHMVRIRLNRSRRAVRGYFKDKLRRSKDLLSRMTIQDRTPSLSPEPIRDVDHDEALATRVLPDLRPMDIDREPIPSDQKDQSSPTCPRTPLITDSGEYHDCNTLPQGLSKSIDASSPIEEFASQRSLATKPESCTELNGVGSHLDGPTRNPAEKQETHTKEEPTAPKVQSKEDIHMPRGPAVPREIHRLRHDQPMKPVGGTKSWSTVASTSTSSSTDYSSARATSPGRPDSRTDIYDSPRRFSIATSMTSVETFRLDEHFEQAAHQDELAHIKKRFSSYSHSSVESHSEPETPSRRLIVTLPPDANINSTEAAKALSMSLSFGSSHDGTQGWVEKQRQANTRGSQAMEETIQGEETPREDVCFQPGTALLQTGVGAINSGHLSPIDEVQSDAGCSLQASTVMGYDPQGNPITKSPTSEPRSRNSTEATSVSEDFADPIEPDETSETDEYSETNDSEDLSMFSLDSSLDPRIRELLLTLKDSVVSLVLQSLQDWIQSYSPDQDAGANFFDGQSGAGSTPNEDDDSARGDKEGGAKRRRDNDGGNGSGRDNNDEADKRRKTGLSSTREKAVEIFACHFVKRYPDEEWPSKCKNGWSEIPRLKTHLYEVHMLKPSCPICLTEFKDSEARDQHIRKRGCVEKDAPRGTRGLTNEMRDQIKDRRGIQRMPKEKHWEKIWKILFRDAPAPSDPYQEPDPETAAEQATLRKFLNKYKEDIKKEAVERTTQGGKDIIPFELLQRLAPVLNDAIGKAISSAVSSALKAAPEALGTGALQGDPESSRAGSLSLPRENSHVESLDYGNFQGRFHQATSLEPGEWIEAGPLQESQGDAQHVLPDGTDVSRLSNILFDDGPGSWDLGQGMAEGGGQYTDPAQPGGCMDPSLLKYNDSLPGV